MNAHAEVVSLLEQLRDRAKVFSPRTQAEFNAVTDSIETLTRAYMSPEVSRDWAKFKLTRKEERMAQFLHARFGAICTKEQLMDAMYPSGVDDPPTEKILGVLMCKVRKKLMHFRAPVGIETVWGVGYRMVKAEDCKFEPPQLASEYTETVMPRHTSAHWDGLTVPSWSVPALELLENARLPVTGEALSVATGRCISDFQNRLRELRTAISSKYQIFNVKGVGYTLARNAGASSALQALAAA